MKMISISVFAVFTRISIFTTLLAAVIFLKEKLNPKIFFLAIIAFLGVLLTIDPGLLGLEKEGSKISRKRIFNGTNREYIGISLMVYLLLAMAGVRTVLTYIAKELQITPNQNLFFLHFGLLQWSVLMNFSDPFVFHSSEILNYFLIGMAGGCYQYCLVKASKYEPNPGVVMIIQSMLVFFSYFCDVFLFGKILSFWNFVGGGLVVFSSLMMIFLKSNRKT